MIGLRRPRPATSLTLLIACAAFPTPGQSQGAPLSERVSIALEHDSEFEQATRDSLLVFLDRHDVERWMWTYDFLIDQDAIPHSHPVLTLHTRERRNPAVFMATFVHEQFHWWAEERPVAEAAAIAELRALFPDVPVGAPDGARDEYSTYLHLIVCDLEFQAMTQLFGEEQAREVLAATRHYTWIYSTLLEDPRVREIVLRHGFDARARRVE